MDRISSDYVTAIKAALDEGMKMLSHNLWEQIYGPSWLNVPGGKEELIARLQALSAVDKALIGLEE